MNEQDFFTVQVKLCKQRLRGYLRCDVSSIAQNHATYPGTLSALRAPNLVIMFLFSYYAAH